MNMYEMRINHDGLNKFRVIRGNDPSAVQEKAEAQSRAWDEMWIKNKVANAKRAEKERKALDKESKIRLAAEQTAEAEAAVVQLDQVLLSAIQKGDLIDWESLEDKSVFPKPRPVEPPKPVYAEKPLPFDMSFKPNPHEKQFQPHFDFFDRFLSGKKQRKIVETREKYAHALQGWKRRLQEYKELVCRHNEVVSKVAQLHKESSKTYKGALRRWESEKAQFLSDQERQHQEVQAKKKSYFDLLPSAIVEYCEMVLLASEYPTAFPQSVEPEYISSSKTLVVDYFLPGLEDIPSVKFIRYVQSQDRYVTTSFSGPQIAKLYDDVIYKIVLRTLYELFGADRANALESVVFNGIVDSIDKATGQRVKPCILSLHVSKSEFTPIDLTLVDPKACFKKLKGVGSSKLHSMTPVAPVMQISREDKRFVPSYGVAQDLDDSVNLAAMDWEDFEHLIRELFEKEFSVNGGEVRVTQASRDGGVDAVAFDPDPIRGGKIVIQAKRYTNVVGVSAVRDLFGTVMNEGALKGILVTTSNYGPDAFEFAKGKPLTLLDGGNLLHLLGKHGHRARINIREAKTFLAQRDKS